MGGFGPATFPRTDNTKAINRLARAGVRHRSANLEARAESYGRVADEWRHRQDDESSDHDRPRPSAAPKPQRDVEGTDNSDADGRHQATPGTLRRRTIQRSGIDCRTNARPEGYRSQPDESHRRERCQHGGNDQPRRPDLARVDLHHLLDVECHSSTVPAPGLYVDEIQERSLTIQRSAARDGDSGRIGNDLNADGTEVAKQAGSMSLR